MWGNFATNEGAAVNSCSFIKLIDKFYGVISPFSIKRKNNFGEMTDDFNYLLMAVTWYTIPLNLLHSAISGHRILNLNKIF